MIGPIYDHLQNFIEISLLLLSGAKILSLPIGDHGVEWGKVRNTVATTCTNRQNLDW